MSERLARIALGVVSGLALLAAVAIAFNETVRWLETRCSTWRT